MSNGGLDNWSKVKDGLYLFDQVVENFDKEVVTHNLMSKDKDMTKFMANMASELQMEVMLNDQ